MSGELASFGDPNRWTDETLFPKHRTGSAERPRDHENVSHPRSVTARNAFRAADGSDAEHELVRARRIAAEHRRARLGETFVELQHVLERRLPGDRQAHDQTDRVGPRRGEITEIHRCRPEAELA